MVGAPIRAVRASPAPFPSREAGGRAIAFVAEHPRDVVRIEESHVAKPEAWQAPAVG